MPNLFKLFQNTEEEGVFPNSIYKVKHNGDNRARHPAVKKVNIPYENRCKRPQQILANSSTLK